jgi:RNA polymerase sigma-70 factor, ECF subfamily
MEPTEQFEALRPQLLRTAYRLLGSVADAEDIVQEAWLRLQRVQAPDAIVDLSAYMRTTVTRLAYDQLGSARVRRESYVGEWLPEPLVEAPDPSDQVTLDESVSTALMLVLERLSPAERTAFVLHDSFGMPFEQVAEVVGRSPQSVRQLAARARRHVHEARPRRPASADEHRRIVGAFAAACEQGDLSGLLTLLDPDVVWRSDGGGKVSSSLRAQHGGEHVARALVKLSAKFAQHHRPIRVNGAPGTISVDRLGVITVTSVTIDNGRIVAINSVRNPDKLGHLPR